MIDWYSRAVLAWERLNTLDAGFCVRAVRRAMDQYGVPEIFNPDQGCQCTAAGFTRPLLAAGVKLSMDGKGRYPDNIFVERLWRTVQYDEIHLKSYGSQIEAENNLAVFFRFSNERRPTARSAGMSLRWKSTAPRPAGRAARPLRRAFLSPPAAAQCPQESRVKYHPAQASGSRR